MTHGSVIQAVVANALSIPLKDQFKVYIPTGSATQISYFEDFYDNFDSEKAKKRDCGIKIQLDELAEAIPAPLSGTEADSIALRDFLNGFIRSLPKEQRKIFIKGERGKRDHRTPCSKGPVIN